MTPEDPKPDNERSSDFKAILRGTLQVTLAMMGAASCTGWLLLGFLSRSAAGPWTLPAALGVMTILYGLLGFALGAVMGRRQRARGLVSATLGTMLAWGIIEFFLSLAGSASPELRAPLIFGIPMCVIGGVVGMSRRADREAVTRELRAELEELQREDETDDEPHRE